MKKEILEQLKLTLEEIKQKEAEKIKKDNEIIALETEKIYYEIWQLILRTISKTKYFYLDIFSKDRLVTLKINKKTEKKIKTQKTIPFNNIKDKLVEDGLEFYEYGGTGFYISRQNLKKIVEPKPKEKSYGGFQLGPCEGQAHY